MSIESDDRRDLNHILSTALDDPKTISDRQLERVLALLGSDARRVRVGAAWVVGIVADDSPGRLISHLPDIAAYLEAPATREAATRALAYVTQVSPGAIERELQDLDEELARRCRQALWGQFAPKNVVRPGDSEDAGGAAMGRPDADDWGWMGGSGRSYDTESDVDRHRPPADRPVDSPSVDDDYDRYTPIETLHWGATAQTFKVVYRGPDGDANPGLFKRFSPTDDRDWKATFGRRIRLWNAIDDHDAILPVVDWGTEPDPWVVTAYEDVTGVSALGGRDRIEAAVWTLGELADALAYAHERGVIHGFLTPGAVVRTSILTEPDAWRYPRLTDWGYGSVLRTEAGDETIPDSFATRYLAPEHVDSTGFGRIDGSTDVYGFGAIAHEAFFGTPPFDADGDADGDADAGSHRIPALETAPTVPSGLEGRLPGVEEFLGRCLAARKAERFETVAEMTAALRRITEVGHD